MDKKPIYNERLLTFREAAERLNVSFWFLYRRKNELPLVRLGPRTVRLKENDVLAWANAHVLAAAIIKDTEKARAERGERERAAGLAPIADV